MRVQPKALLLTVAMTLTACATAQENPNYKYSTKFKGAAPSSAYASNTASETRQYSPVSDNGVAQASVSHTGYQYAAQEPTAPLSYTQTVPAAAVTHTHNISQPTISQPNISGHTVAAGYAVTSQPYAAGSHSPSYYSHVHADCVSSGQQGTRACTPAALPISVKSAHITPPYRSTGAQRPQTVFASETAPAPHYETRSYSAGAPVSPTHDLMPESYGTPGYEAMKNAETGWSHEPQNSHMSHPNASAPAMGTPATLSASTANTDPYAPMQPLLDRQHRLGQSHAVVQGDTVYSFARALCSSVEDIKHMNGLDAQFSLQIGQVIRLPASNC